MTREERMNPARCRNDVQRNHLRYIEEFGVSLLSVAPRVGDQAPLQWTYSIGLWQEYRHPEIIIFGLDPGLTKVMLNIINQDLRDKTRRFAAGSSADDLLGGQYTVFFEGIPPEAYADYLAGDDWFYGDHSYPAVQLIWPTTANIYPWQGEADVSFRELQPILSSLPRRVLQ